MEPRLFLLRFRKRGGHGGCLPKDLFRSLMVSQAVGLPVQSAVDLARNRLELPCVREVIQATAVPKPARRTTGKVGAL